jgi:uncharacterized protein
MALILIRAERKGKILNALADLERHAQLKIAGKPRIIEPSTADEIFQGIIKEKLRSKSKIAVMVKVEEDTTKSIMQIRNIHPPAHLMVVSSEYPDFEKIERDFSRLTPLKGYYSLKNYSPKKSIK